MEILKEIKNVFIPPVKRYYLGKQKYGTPYFWPINYNNSILSIRKLRLKTKEELEKYYKQYPYFKNKTDLEFKFANIPLARRCKYRIKKIFNNYYYIELGWPISIKKIELGWKDKFDSPRHEWNPAFHIFFFGFQFSIFWQSPGFNNDDDRYWEMILWYLYYSDRNIEKAEKTWPWQSTKTKQSTWNKNYLK